jgi:FkbH-like protein
MTLPEPIRLVVWDLDETFWQGTLCEGGIKYNQTTHDTVIELARRGVMNSICSKNDFDSVSDILKQTGIWEYFIFPSISWETKGPRLKTLVEATRLRPSSVLFIDDNPMNLNEARHFLPEIQISDETCIPNLLSTVRFSEKYDPELSRLKQYKQLEVKRLDEINAMGNNYEFLRNSNIKVSIDHDITSNIDRAIELINRTNQLNFTKVRLSEDIDNARAELSLLLSQFLVHAGLIRVTDRYGDYGFVGFYLMRSSQFSKRLEHYCFSCRTLGMHVESWLYNKLERPEIQIQGEVLGDLSESDENVDWIKMSSSGTDELISVGPGELPRILLRGGCDLLALQHYVKLYFNHVVSEVNQPRDGFPIRTDHSSVMRLSLEGLRDGELEVLEKLGYRREDFATCLLGPPVENDVWVLSFWADASFPVYRHRRLGFRIPLHPAHPMNISGMRHDLTTVDILEIPEWLRLKDHWIVGAFQVLKEEFVWEDLISEAEFKITLRRVLDRKTDSTRIFIIGAIEDYEDNARKFVKCNEQIALNRWCNDIVSLYRNVTVLPIKDFMKSNEDMLTLNHFERQVYFRIHQRIQELIS